MTLSATTDLRRTWEAAAPGWARWEPAYTEGFRAATEAMLDMAGVSPGMRVLDVACGAGSQTLLAAARVGPAGRVVATDIAASMLEHVQRNAAAAGLGNIAVRVAAADEVDTALPGDGPFDAAICRMALMHFPAPGQALQAICRTLRPGARFAALVFSTPAGNPMMAEPMAILRRHAGKAPPPPGTPGIFALGGDGVLEGLLRQEGFGAVEVRRLPAGLSFASAAEALAMLREAAGAYRAVAAELDETTRDRAWQEVEEALSRHVTPRGFEARLEVIVGAGTVPGLHRAPGLSRGARRGAMRGD